VSARPGFRQTGAMRPPDEVEVSRPDKLLWPDAGVTKAGYRAYLDAVAEHMLPWLRRRPLTVIRAPDGVGGERYFQKSASSYTPAWIATIEIPAPSAKRDVRYVVCDHRQALVWLGNQAALEFHPAPVRVDRLDRPDWLVFDVDPPDGGFADAVRVARLVLEHLGDAGLEAGVKTTGGKGLHVLVPVERRYGTAELRAAAAAVTAAVAAREPDLVTDEFRKADRAGRVMLDPSRNAPGATVVAPYSPRGRAEATVSFPVTPQQLGRIAPEDFTVSSAPALLDGDGPTRWLELSERRFRIPASLLGGPAAKTRRR
jgi:bifunctional non-homologous end joining protein LigD